jgi:MFS family permease
VQFNITQADKISSVVFCVLGITMLVGGYQMDRLEIRQIHPASIPGLVPMILGAALTICSTLLYLEAYKNKSSESKIETEFVSWKNLFVCALISCIYALILVGWLSFYLATAIYITFFILYFSREELLTANLRKKTIIIAFTVGPLAAISISALFRYGFLVRLP